MRDKALAEWNSKQPPYKPVLRYEQLTPTQQSVVDLRAEELSHQYTGNLISGLMDVVYEQSKQGENK